MLRLPRVRHPKSACLFHPQQYVIAAQLIDDAKAKESPLHDYFEWNNKRAAERWRIEQARYLLRGITVVITTPEGEERTTRAFHSVTLDGSYEINVPKTYVTVQRAMSEDELRTQVIEEALKKIKSWQRRYKEYKEFAKIVQAIDETLKEIE